MTITEAIDMLIAKSAEIGAPSETPFGRGWDKGYKTALESVKDLAESGLFE